MSLSILTKPCLPAVARRAEELLQKNQHELYQRTDRLFACLMVVQWLAMMAANMDRDSQSDPPACLGGLPAGRTDHRVSRHVDSAPPRNHINPTRYRNQSDADLFPAHSPQRGPD